MKHLAGPLVGFETVQSIEAMLAEMNPQYRKRPTQRYPTRYLRYWFMRHSLDRLHAELNRPLRVLEVGIGYGKMLAFMGGPRSGPQKYSLPSCIERWDAISAQADPRTLNRYSYSSFRHVDLDKQFDVSPGDYDAVIVLHVLEHLTAPETTLQRLISALQNGGLLIGGSPTMPAFMAAIHEGQLRRKYADRMADVTLHKHLSVISPARIRRFAKAEGLSIELLSGAFLVRSSRSPLENYRWWMRMNLAWGAMFPALAGEVYFALRKVRPALIALMAMTTGEMIVGAAA